MLSAPADSTSLYFLFKSEPRIQIQSYEQCSFTVFSTWKSASSRGIEALSDLALVYWITALSVDDSAPTAMCRAVSAALEDVRQRHQSGQRTCLCRIHMSDSYDRAILRSGKRLDFARLFLRLRINAPNSFAVPLVLNSMGPFCSDSSYMSVLRHCHRWILFAMCWGTFIGWSKFADYVARHPHCRSWSMIANWVAHSAMHRRHFDLCWCTLGGAAHSVVMIKGSSVAYQWARQLRCSAYTEFNGLGSSAVQRIINDNGVDAALELRIRCYIHSIRIDDPVPLVHQCNSIVSSTHKLLYLQLKSMQQASLVYHTLSFHHKINSIQFNLHKGVEWRSRLLLPHQSIIKYCFSR